MNHLPADRVVLLTPEGRGAVASLRIEGPRAADLVGRHFSGPKAPLAQGRIHVGRWGTAVPEEVVVCRLEPERIEVHCHGGAAALQRIVADLVQEGCSAVSWRAWIGLQEPHPIRAAARVLLAEAQTERTAAVLLDQYNGALDRAIDTVILALESEDAIAAVRLDELLNRAAVGLHLVEPWRVVLAGPPNAGKSSLVNALVGYRRSIVHDAPGTTRDAVSASLAFDGWPVELIDTAGLRKSDDPLELAGIERAGQQLAAADAVLLVFDAAQPWTAGLAAMADQFPAAIVAHNKMDLIRSQDSGDSDATPADRPPGIAASALAGAGIETLIARVISRLACNDPAAGAAVPFTASQVAKIREARKYVDQGEWAAATAALRVINDTDVGHDGHGIAWA
jgi:tRNA modification GTPase